MHYSKVRSTSSRDLERDAASQDCNHQLFASLELSCMQTWASYKHCSAGKTVAVLNPEVARSLRAFRLRWNGNLSSRGRENICLNRFKPNHPTFRTLTCGMGFAESNTPDLATSASHFAVNSIYLCSTSSTIPGGGDLRLRDSFFNRRHSRKQYLDLQPVCSD